jgi:hypothetical protein
MEFKPCFLILRINKYKIEYLVTDNNIRFVIELLLLLILSYEFLNLNNKAKLILKADICLNSLYIY